MVVGFYAWLYQLNYGLGVTGMNLPVFWGIYIVTFVFFIGVSAGGIAVASLSHLLEIEKFKPISMVAEIVAVISLILAMIMIFLDLGRPDRILNLFIYFKLDSPLVWDVFVINIYLILCLGMLFFSIINKMHLVKIFAVISIPTFVLVHSITAWIFGLMKSQPGWHTSILAPLFIASALVSGLALIIMALIFSKRFLDFEIDDEVITDLGWSFKILLPILFYFLFCEFLTTAFAGIPAHSVVLREILVGKFASIFWFDIALGIIMPFFIIISKFGKTLIGVGIASAFSFFGVFAERINIVVPSFYHPLLSGDRSVYLYKPTWVEYSIIAALFAFGIVIFILASKIIPLLMSEDWFGGLKTLSQKTMKQRRRR